MLLLLRHRRQREAGNAGDIAFSPDGAQLISISNTPIGPGNNLEVYNAASLGLISGARTSVAAEAWLDVISTGDLFVTDDQNAITSFSANLTQTGKRSFDLVPGRTGVGRVSSDEQARWCG